MIDRHNYHLFQPLLYQVATAALSPGDITEPIRVVLRHQQNATVLLDEVIGIAARQVKTRFGAAQSYDYLVLATGSQYTYFGHSEWPRLAPGLKSVDDATLIRRRLLLAFEEAETVADPAIRRRLLTFVLVGAGPTGVEMAGAMDELGSWMPVSVSAPQRHEMLALHSRGSAVLPLLPRGALCRSNTCPAKIAEPRVDSAKLG